MAHLCKNFHTPQYTISNHALFTDVFCSSDVIHLPCNILGYLVWPFRFVAVLVFGIFGRLWSFRFVAVSVSGVCFMVFEKV